MTNRHLNAFFERLEYYIRTYNFLGIVLGLTFFCLSLTPSLLPRPSYMQGIISGFALAVGYGLGVLLSFLIRWLTEAEIKSSLKRTGWNILYYVIPISYVFFIFCAEVWQNDVRRLVGEPVSPGSHIVSIGVLAFIVFILIITIARLIRRGILWLGRQIDRFLPRRLSYTLGTVIGAVIIIWIVNGFLATTLETLARNFYDHKNATTAAGVSQPTSQYRSGSPESYVPWNTIGYQGQKFVSQGPSIAQMQTFSGTVPTQQIRIYAGIKSAPTADSRAQLVVQEMKRTGAFSRKVIILATTTGTGWLEPQSVDSLEYMYNGDSAIVTQQYSDLPSWISFLVDKQTATDAGQALYNAVYGQWALLPKETRPKLIAYGLSLGSFGGQAAYSGVQALTLSIDGALFMGTPDGTPLWSNITANRDIGSPEWQPIYQNGKTVRFASSNTDITQNETGWTFPRILYMQHANDPVVWFSFNLPLHEPDWLIEARGPGVSTMMFWYPFVTFLQVTVDQFYGVTVPSGSGHNYPNTIVNAWGAVVPPVDWNADQAAKLQTIINSYPID